MIRVSDARGGCGGCGGYIPKPLTRSVLGVFCRNTLHTLHHPPFPKNAVPRLCSREWTKRADERTISVGLRSAGQRKAHLPKAPPKTNKRVPQRPVVTPLELTSGYSALTQGHAGEHGAIIDATNVPFWRTKTSTDHSIKKASDVLPHAPIPSPDPGGEG